MDTQQANMHLIEGMQKHRMDNYVASNRAKLRANIDDSKMNPGRPNAPSSEGVHGLT